MIQALTDMHTDVPRVIIRAIKAAFKGKCCKLSCREAVVARVALGDSIWTRTRLRQAGVYCRRRYVPAVRTGA